MADRKLIASNDVTCKRSIDNGQIDGLSSVGISCTVMGKVCALLWVAFVLLTTRLPPLTDGCGITASVSLINGDNRVAEEGGTLVLYWHSVVLIWCRNATPTHSIYHDDTLVFTTSPEFPLYELEEFSVEQQGVYRCDCGSGRNSLNLVLLSKFFHCAGCDVWSGASTGRPPF